MTLADITLGDLGLSEADLVMIARMAIACETEPLARLEVEIHVAKTLDKLRPEVQPRWADPRSFQASPHVFGSHIRLREFVAAALRCRIGGRLPVDAQAAGLKDICLARVAAGPRSDFSAHDLLRLRAVAAPVLDDLLVRGRARWPAYAWSEAGKAQG